MAKGTMCCSPGFLAQARPRGLFSSASLPQPCLDLSPQGQGRSGIWPQAVFPTAVFLGATLGHSLPAHI